jgi:NTP pyrophosphatase (non-canonical NTP hydrolase)
MTNSIDLDPAVAVNTLIQACHGPAKVAGWWVDPKTGLGITDQEGRALLASKGLHIALIHSELSEALEGIRKTKPDDHLPHLSSEAVELADAVIRCFDYAGGYGIDLATALVEKLAYNAHRPDHKMENRQKEGGKAF